MAILKNPTANWLFELDTSAIHTPGSAQLSYLEGFLEKLQQCAEILARRDLFSPSRVALSQWIKIDGDVKIVLEKPINYLDVANDQDMRLDLLIMQEILSEQQGSGAIRPAYIEVHGWSRLAGANCDTQVVANMVSINAFFTGGGAIDVCVFGDMWLPFSLDGKTRYVSHEENAVRLELALQEIERVLGSEPIVDDFSDFCTIHGYRLKNFMDDDGSVIGMDHLGRVLREMNFRDVYVRKEERFSVGIEDKSGRFYVSFPVRNQFVDYEEYYEIDRAEFDLFQTDLQAAMEFVKAARERRMDERLIQEPGRLRGWAT